MEVNTQRRLAGLKEKVPDIQKTLEMVRFLSRRKVRLLTAVHTQRYRCSRGPRALTRRRVQSDAEPLEATYELNDTLYAKALVPHTEEVYLWLGVCTLSTLDMVCFVMGRGLG